MIKLNGFKAIFTKSQVGSISKQAFHECVSWISKQIITLNCDKIEPATKKKDKERLIAGSAEM